MENVGVHQARHSGGALTGVEVRTFFETFIRLYFHVAESVFTLRRKMEAGKGAELDQAT